MLLQLPSIIQKIDTKYSQNYRLAKKKDKDSKRNKSTNTFPIDIPNKK